MKRVTWLWATWFCGLVSLPSKLHGRNLRAILILLIVSMMFVFASSSGIELSKVEMHTSFKWKVVENERKQDVVVNLNCISR